MYLTGSRPVPIVPVQVDDEKAKADVGGTQSVIYIDILTNISHMENFENALQYCQQIYTQGIFDRGSAGGIGKTFSLSF
jgi:hypothetical protein